MTDQPCALIIEDEEDVRDLLEEHLLMQGYRVACADTGERGLALAMSDPPGVVIVDIGLPGIDGREVIRRLRADPRTADCPVVVCSVLDTQDLHDIQADAVLAKPFGGADVTKIVNVLWHRDRGESR